MVYETLQSPMQSLGSSQDGIDCFTNIKIDRFKIGFAVGFLSTGYNKDRQQFFTIILTNSSR